MALHCRRLYPRLRGPRNARAAFIRGEIIGLWEGVLQTLAFSMLLVTWHKRPHRAWGIVMGGLTTLAILMSIAGAVLPRPEAFQ